MQRILKAGAIILVLVVPVLIFLFLRLFGENHFTLKTYYPLTDPGSGAVITQRSPTASWWQMQKDTVYYAVPAYTISIPPKDSTSGRLKLKNTKDFAGRLTILSFNGSACDQTCLRVAGQVNRVLDIFTNDSSIVALTLVDRLAAVNAIKKQYDPRPERWFYGQPTHKAVQRVAEYEYRFGQRPILKPEKETFAFNEGLVLVDKDGHIRGYYKGTDKEDVDRLVLEIRILLDIYAKKSPPYGDA
ncbi:SCO family protein [Tellurirhabdus rosea]|uniref:SCO family protein n=1 Tax=Tellurirhabdus rosea TaxID=2674997 RepID=UPI002252BD57|nr:hypothetical protein [Tellurirhabdus rosea]